MKKLFTLILGILVTGAFFVGCSDDDDAAVETANLKVTLVDEPGDYLEANVNVQAVEITLNGELMEFPFAQRGPVDLRTLTAGNFASLLDTTIPAGRLSQIRLILGAEGNNVVIEGETEGTTRVVDLQTPSAQQSGLKLNVDTDLQPGVSVNFILDFNVNKSIVPLGAGAGSQGLLLKPVIRVTTEALSGAISGSVSTTGEIFTVTAVDISNPEVTVSTYTNEAGEFLLFAVPEGNFDVSVATQTTTEKEGELLFTREGVSVIKGSTTDLGLIQLQQQ